jgi:hypothetical protein
VDNTRPGAASGVPAPATADPECSPTPRHRWQPPRLLNDWTGRLFIAGVSLIGLHLADEVPIEPVDGRRTLARSLLTVVVLAVLGLLTLGFAAAGIRIRAVIAIAIGIYGTITGIGLTTMRVVELGVSGSDWTGIPGLVIGGFGLVGLGAVLLVRAVRRRFLRLLALPIGVCVAFYLVVPLIYAIYLTHPPPTPLSGATPGDRGFAFEDIRIPTRDGEVLAGWYIPSRTGATIAVLHGSGSNRSSTLDHGVMLARHGFGVLFLDARGHSQSTGQGMDLGWHGPADISAVLDYLTDRPDVRAGDALLLVKGWVAGSSAGDGVPVLGSVKVVHPVGCST